MKLFNVRTVSKFLTVGATSALIYFLMFSLFYGVLQLNYRLAVSIAYVLSVIVHFSGNRYFTFKAEDEAIHKHLMRYLVMIGINYGITLVVMQGVVERLHWVPYVGVVCSIAVTMGCGFLLMQLWVFKGKK